MKFTQVQAFEKIKAILGQTQQISDRTINDTLENLLVFAGEEEELDAFVTKVTKTFTSLDGNLRKEVSDTAKRLADSAAEEAKKKTKTPEEIAAQKLIDDAEAAKFKDEPEWAKVSRLANEKRIADLEARLLGDESKRTIEQLKTSAIQAAKTAKYDEKIINSASRNFDWTKPDADKLFAEECVHFANEFGVTPPAGGEIITKNDAAGFAAQRAKLQEQGIIPKDI
jgi:hypothetical protein